MIREGHEDVAAVSHEGGLGVPARPGATHAATITSGVLALWCLTWPDLDGFLEAPLVS